LSINNREDYWRNIFINIGREIKKRGKKDS
jgi:hypothetical protein